MSSLIKSRRGRRPARNGTKKTETYQSLRIFKVPPGPPCVRNELSPGQTWIAEIHEWFFAPFFSWPANLPRSSSSVKLNLIHKIREELSHVLQISDWDLRFWWHTSNWMPSDGPGSWWNGICWLISCTHTLVLNCFENLETSFAIPTGFGLDSEMWIITAAVCQMQLIRLKTGLDEICRKIIRDKLVRINLRQNLIILPNVDWDQKSVDFLEV